MFNYRTYLFASALSVASLPAFGQDVRVNNYVGTWRMVSAQVDPDGKNIPAYGPKPNGWLIFTKEMTFVEVLTDARVPRFASDEIGKGTDDENRAAMAGGIGAFGRYTLDEHGVFSGDTVEGSTFPNWVGDVRTKNDLQIIVEGDRMTNHFRRPDGTEIRIQWERIK